MIVKNIGDIQFRWERGRSHKRWLEVINNGGIMVYGAEGKMVMN